MIEVLVRDAAGVAVAPVEGWSSLRVLVKHRDVGSITLSLPVDAQPPEMAALGAGLIVRRDGVNLASGPLANPTWTWGAGDPWPGTITWVCPDDLTWLGQRLVYPDPVVTPASYPPAQAPWAMTGQTETVIREAVRLNASTEAPLVERATILAVDADQARGVPVTAGVWFENLLTWAQATIAPSDLGLRALAVGSGPPVLSFYATRDVSAEVFFAAPRGNLDGWTMVEAASTGNAAVIVGGDKGTRSFLEASTLSRWGWRAETYVDAQGVTVAAELAQRRDEALAQAPDSVDLQTLVVDTTDVRFGRDYAVGDTVGVYLSPTRVERLPVQQVEISVDRTGVETVIPSIGTGGPRRADQPPSFAAVRELTRQLQSIQRRP